MSASFPPRDAPDRITAEAGAWFARMHSDQITSQDEAAFAEWLDENPEHQTAYIRAANLWTDLGALAGKPEMVTMMRRLDSAPSHDRRLLLGGAAVGMLGLSGALWLGARLLRPSHTFETAFGEQRRVVLPDGSALMLNTETRIRAEFNEHERRLWLDHGQSFFDVASDPARPFRVFAGDEEVRALGTQFEVRRAGDGVKVTLEEGSIAIIRNGAARRLDAPPPAAVMLEAGQQALITPVQSIEIAAVDTRRITAWRFGQMALDADPLSAAVAEINRYNARQIVIDNAELNELPISGLFQTGSPEAFAEAVSAVLPVEIASNDERAIHLRRRGP